MKKILFAIIFATCLISCADKNTPRIPGRNDPIVGIGHGVYYFDLVGQDFCIALAKFNLEHEVISIASDNRGSYGSTSGYIVVCNEK